MQCVTDAAACGLYAGAETDPSWAACDDSTDCPPGQVCCSRWDKGGGEWFCASADDCQPGSQAPARNGQPYGDYLDQVCKADCDCSSGHCGAGFCL